MGRGTEEYQTRVSGMIDGLRQYGYHANKAGELTLLEIHPHNIFKYFTVVFQVNYILLLYAQNNNCIYN